MNLSLKIILVLLTVFSWCDNIILCQATGWSLISKYFFRGDSMKKLVSILLTGAVMFSLSGCSKNAAAGEQEKVIPVKVMDVKEENYPVLLEYLGNTNSEDIIKYSFKVPGKIAQINVKEGDYVKQGQVLAVLDNQDYNFAVDGARGQMDAASGQMQAAQGKISMAEAQVAAAKAQYDKAMNGAQKEDINSAKLAVKNAENTYNYAKESYTRVEKLYKEGIVSKQQLDDVKIKLDGAKVALDNSKEVLSKAENGARAEDKESALAQYNAAKAQHEAAKSQYQAAQGQYNASQTQYESKQSMVNDTVLKSEVSGYVVKVLNKAGENTAAGYPVVVIRTEEQVIDIQIAQNDIQKITIGTKANVKINDMETEGVIAEIDQTPDAKSRTYKAKIKMNTKIPPDKFYIGTVAKVNIKLSNKKGIWLPITTILNDGEDYVYVVDKERISRKNVTIESIYGDKVLVTGVSLSDKVVTEGLKNIKPGYKVNVVK